MKRHAAAPALETARDRADRGPSPSGSRPQTGTGADPQRDLDLRLIPRALRLSIDLRDIPVDRYRLPKDGRKWKWDAHERAALAAWLATYGNADGTGIETGIKSIVRRFGWSRSKVFYRLDELKELGLLESLGRAGQRGTRKRFMKIAEFKERASLEVQDTRSRSKIRGSESKVSLDTTVQTVQTENPGAQTAPLNPAAKQPAVSFLFSDQAKEIEDRRKTEARDRREKQEALARSKDTIVRIEANVGAGPEAPPPRYCKECGRTKFFHTISRENQKRHDPKWEPHEFVPESAVCHEARAG